MEIKKPDSKGRVLIGADPQTVYSISRNDNGTVILSPIEIPQPPKFAKSNMLGVYWSPGRHSEDTLTIFADLPKDSASFVANIANRLGVPVIVDGSGMGAAHVDQLREIAGEVIVVLGDES